MNIPFNKAYQTGFENKYINDAMIRNHLSGDGYYTKKVQKFIEETFDIKKSLLTTSCTHALEMAGMLIDLQPGDEVILPSYTFVSTVNAIMLRGATPIFAEINSVTLNIDPVDVESKISKKTKAIFVVHYAGIGCDMNYIMELALKFNLWVVEDAAQGVNAKYNGRYLGSIGHIGCYSFHETKNYSCGEGGAVTINSMNSDLFERAEIIREKGTNRSKFFRGQVDKYTWVDIGSSYLPSDILAAFLWAQFENLEKINELRKQTYENYYYYLLKFEDQGILRLPSIPKNCQSNYHMFHIVLPTEDIRNNLMSKLKEKGINAVFHYVPLHLSPMGLQLNYKPGDLPITEKISATLLRLPMYAGMTLKDQEYILENLNNILLKSAGKKCC